MLRLVITFCCIVAATGAYVSAADNSLGGIIGGRNTTIQKHPYHVTIVGECSGAIINNRWVLTLASCVIPYYVDIKKYPIRTGSNKQTTGGKLYYIDKAVIHTNFTFATTMYNFALLKTNETIKFNKNTRKVGYSTRKVKAATPGVLSGWSEDEKGNKDTFKEVDMKTINFIKCQKMYNSGSVHVYESMFCAFSKDKKQGPCGYDYGDPIVSKKELIGLFTLYVQCPAEEYPSIFADVTSVAKWIKQTISHS